jgi:hypothetical protein
MKTNSSMSEFNLCIATALEYSIYGRLLGFGVQKGRPEHDSVLKLRYLDGPQQYSFWFFVRTSKMNWTQRMLHFNI